MSKCRILIVVSFVCVAIGLLSACSGGEGNINDWGSFTADKTYSYDEKYYANQGVVEGEDAKMVKVTICLADTDEVIAAFEPARARDFWGICWEEDTYNIWAQSADIGILCYAYHNGAWTLDEGAERPSYMISKYDQ